MRKIVLNLNLTGLYVRKIFFKNRFKNDFINCNSCEYVIESN